MDTVDSNETSGTSEQPCQPTRVVAGNGKPTSVSRRMAMEWRPVDRILVSVGVFFITFITALDGSATGTIQPQVLSDFNSMTRAGVISMVMYLLLAGIRPVFAKVSDRFGYLHALVATMLLHTTGFLICALAQGFASIFAGTVISGFGMAGYGTMAAIILADALPIHLRGSITAYTSVPNITNYYLGVEIGGRLVDRWRWVYGILCILAVVCAAPIVLALLHVDRRTRRTRCRVDTPAQDSRPLLMRLWKVLLELDVPGLVLLSGGLIAILAPLGMQLNSTYGWASVQVLVPITAGLVALAVFVYYENRVAEFPVIPFRLLRIRTMACAAASAMLFFYTFNVTLFYFNAYLQTTRRISAHEAMMLQQGQSGYFVGLLVGGWAMQWSRRYRRWAWTGWCLVLLAVGLMIRTRNASATSNAEVAAVQVLFGIGGGLVVGSIGVGVQAAVDIADLPIAITLYGMVEYIGGVLGEGTATTVWVNMLPVKLKRRLNPDVDVHSTINNITYFNALPSDQQAIVQDAYTQTQMVLTICGMCAMALAAAAMLGLAPLSLAPETKDKQAADDADSLASGSKSSPHAGPAA